MKRTALAVLLASVAAPVLQAETVSLEQAVERALEADPRIRERQHFVDAARALLQEATGHGNAIFDVNAFVGLTPGVRGGFFERGAETCQPPDCRPRSDLYDFDDGISPWTGLQFSVIKPLYTFGKIERYAAAAQGNVDVKRGDVRIQRADTRFDTTRAYYGYLTARDTRLLLEDVRGRVQGAIGVAQRWLEEGNGEVRQSDIFALQSGLGILNNYLAQARAVESIALDGLRTLMGMPLDAELQLADPGIAPVELPTELLSDLIEQALSQRPEMGQLEAGLRARRSLVEANKAERLPNVYAGVVGSLSYAPRRDRLDNPHIYDPFNHIGVTPVLGLKWDWASGVQPARVAQAQAELDALIERAAFAQRGIPFEVAEQFHRVQAMHTAVQELTQASRAGRRWMVSTYADFEAGLEEGSKVLEAMRGYALAHTEYLAAVNEYNLHVARMRRAVGMDQ
jgi:outer membrane protein